MSLGFTAAGTGVGAALGWLGGRAVRLTVFFGRDTAVAGALFTGATLLTCAVFTPGFDWEQEEQKGTQQNQVTPQKKPAESW